MASLDMNYDSLKRFIQDYVLQPTNGLVSFSMSDDNRVLALIRDQVYPQLQLDTPSFVPEKAQNGKHIELWSTTIAILAEGGQDDNWTKQEQQLEILLPEIRNLIAYLFDVGKKLPGVKVESLGQTFPVKRYEASNNWGWALSVTLENRSQFCYDGSGDVAIDHLMLIQEEGIEQEVGLHLFGQNFGVTWQVGWPKKRVLTRLETAINDSAIPLSAQFWMDEIILISESNQIQYSTPPNALVWQILS